MTEVPQPPPQPTPTGPPGEQKGNAIALAGMILGIIALALFCIWYVSLPCAIIGLILSILGKKKAEETGVGAGKAKAGVILCVIALALAVVMTILGIIGISILGKKMKEMQPPPITTSMLPIRLLLG